MDNGTNDRAVLTENAFDTGALTNMENMFAGCASLPCLDIRFFDVDQVTSMRSMFLDCGGLTELDVSKLNFFMNESGWESMFPEK